MILLLLLLFEDYGATEMYLSLPGVTVTPDSYANGEMMSCEFYIQNEITFPASGFIRVRIPDEIEIVNPMDRFFLSLFTCS